MTDPLVRLFAVCQVAHDAGVRELDKAATPMPEIVPTMKDWIQCMRRRINAYERAHEWFTLAENTAYEIARLRDKEPCTPPFDAPRHPSETLAAVEKIVTG